MKEISYYDHFSSSLTLDLIISSSANSFSNMVATQTLMNEHCAYVVDDISSDQIFGRIIRTYHRAHTKPRG
jgi:hypothetical protein